MHVELKWNNDTEVHRWNKNFRWLIETMLLHFVTFFFLVLLEIFKKEEENKLLITGYFEWNNITLNCFELFTDSKSHLNSFSSRIKFLRCLQSGTYLVGATSSNIWKKIVTLSEKKKNILFELKIYESIKLPIK